MSTKRGRIFSDLPRRTVGAIFKLDCFAMHDMIPRDLRNFTMLIIKLLKVYHLVTISSRKAVTKEKTDFLFLEKFNLQQIRKIDLQRNKKDQKG